MSAAMTRIAWRNPIARRTRADRCERSDPRNAAPTLRELGWVRQSALDEPASRPDRAVRDDGWPPEGGSDIGVPGPVDRQRRHRRRGGATIRAQHSTDQSSWTYLDGATGPSVGVGTTGLK